MKNQRGILYFGVAVLIAGTLWSQTIPPSARAMIYNANGQQIGVATFTAVRGEGVKINLDVSRLSPGAHGVHIHAEGKCTPPGFESAGPHFNPEHQQHGLKNPNGPHAGDLGNIVVGANGKAHVVLLDPRLSLEEGNPNSILRPGGTSIVIHRDRDDEISDPAGNSGPRVACGVIAR